MKTAVMHECDSLSYSKCIRRIEKTSTINSHVLTHLFCKLLYGNYPNKCQKLLLL